MNFGEMITQVQEVFGDTSEAQITIDFIKKMLNNGQRDLARKTLCLPRRAEASSVNGVNGYDVPDDFIKLEWLSYDGETLPRIPRAQLDALNSSRALDPVGTPNCYYTVGRSIFLVPTPDKNGDDNIKIGYIKMPTDLIDVAQIPDLPLSMHEDVVLYALARCKERDEEFEQAAMIQSEYAEKVLAGKDEVFDDNNESYPAVRLLPGDWG